MIIYFSNKTEKSVILELNNDKIELKKDERIKVDSETNRMMFNCYCNENSSFKYLPLSKSVIVEYNFILNSLYDLIFSQDICEINLVQKQVRGNNLEWYNFIDLQLSGGMVNNKEFRVKDELSAKNQLSSAREKEMKLEKKLKAADIFQTVSYVGIPALIIFFGIWHFVDLKTAVLILIPLIAVGIAIGLLFRKMINKFNNKLDKMNSKFEKENEKFIDFNSFFDKNYIYDVLNGN